MVRIPLQSTATASGDSPLRGPWSFSELEDRAMVTTQHVIHLTGGNWSDFFSWEYPESLVQGLAIHGDGIDRQGGVVGLLLEWVTERNRLSLVKRYALARHDAAVVLELAAGRRGEYVY
jgi:hypothetical protein